MRDEAIREAKEALKSTSWESIRKQILLLTPPGCSDSHARRVVERKAINDLRSALAELIGEKI